MAKGTLYGICYDADGAVTDKYCFYVEYETGTPSQEGNYTPLTLRLKVRRDPEHPYAASAYDLTGGVSVSLTVDGVTFWSTKAGKVDTRNAQIWEFTTLTLDAAHEADGTKTVRIGAGFSGVGASSLKRGALSVQIALADIPRASRVSAEDVSLGERVRVKWTPASLDYRYRMTFSLGTWSDTTELVRCDILGEWTYTEYRLPLEAASQIPNTPKGEMKVELFTYADAEGTVLVGSAERTFTVEVPDDERTKPRAMMALSPVDTPLEGLYIAGRSRAQASFTQAEGKYGATVMSYRLRSNGAEYGAPYISGYLTEPVTVVGVVTDSRGYEREYPMDVPVMPYTKPQIRPVAGQDEVIVARCDELGQLTESGIYLMIAARRSYTPLTVDGEARNRCAIRYRYKAESAQGYGDWAVILAAGAQGDEVVTGPLLDGAFSEQVCWVVQVQAIDSLGDVATTTVTVPTDKVYMHRDGERGSLAFGKYVEDDDTFDIAQEKTLKVRGGLVLLGQAYQVILDIAHPVGSVLLMEADPGPVIGGAWVKTGSGTWKRRE